MLKRGSRFGGLKMPENNEMKCCNKNLEFKLQEGKYWQIYRPETATCGTCNTYFERKPNTNIAYKKMQKNVYAQHAVKK
jgi:D-alanyl-D-alanine dipeptidase